MTGRAIGTISLDPTNQDIDCRSKQSVKPTCNNQYNPQEASIKHVIEVVSTMHPLYGQQFNVSSEQNKRYEKTFIQVDYKNNIKLTIPLTATCLNDFQSNIHSKLTLNAIQEIVLLAKELNLCLSSQKVSGKKHQKVCKKQS